MQPVPFAGLRLDLPASAWVDLDAARDAIHRAESATALGDWGRAWGAAQVTLFTARRGFLPGEDLPWISDIRSELESLYVRVLPSSVSSQRHRPTALSPQTNAIPPGREHCPGKP